MRSAIYLAAVLGVVYVVLHGRRRPTPSSVELAGGGVGVGIGMFGGRIEPQQSTEATIAGDTLGSMAEDPGIRLAHGRGKRTYRGGGLSPQVYVEPQGGVNSTEALDALPLSAGTRSRALGQTSRLRLSDLPADQGAGY